MKVKTLLLIEFLFLSILLNAQTDFRPGYIIKNTGDTIYGNIDYRGDRLMSSICKFQGNDGISQEYHPNDIAVYRFIDGKYYISKKVEFKNVFLECLISGKVSVYYLKDEIGIHYYFEKEGIGLNELPYTEPTVEGSDKGLVYKESKKHLGFLYYYFLDEPSLKTQINSIEKPTDQNLIKLTETYNNLGCNDNQCIIYEKKLPAIKVNLEVLGGIIYYRETYGLNNKNYGNYGAIMHIWFPRENEKLFLRTGILYTPEIQSGNEKTAIYKIPFQIEYIYPLDTRIRPRVAYGINYLNPSEITTSILGGLNVKINNRLYWSLNYDLEFTTQDKLPIIPKNLLGYSILTGLYINF